MAEPQFDELMADDIPDPVLPFGKYRGRPLDRIAVEDAGYLQWLLRQSFLDDALALVRGALNAARGGAK